MRPPDRSGVRDEVGGVDYVSINDMSYKAKWLFLFSVLVGVCIWAFSPNLFGVAEPWDASDYSPFNLNPVNLYLLMFGFVFGMVGYERPALHPLGVYVGAFLYGLFTFIKDLYVPTGGGVNFFIPLGAIFLIPFCLPVLVGAFGGAFLRRGVALLKRRAKHSH